MLRLRDNLAYLQNFAKQVADGAQRVDGKFRQRVKLYVNSARGVFHETRRKAERVRGMTEERNVLTGDEHCPGCLDAAAAGWQPIGTLPPIGTRTCLSHCRCHWAFR